MIINLSKAKIIKVNGLTTNEIAYNPAVVIDKINNKKNDNFSITS